MGQLSLGDYAAIKQLIVNAKKYKHSWFSYLLREDAIVQMISLSIAHFITSKISDVPQLFLPCSYSIKLSSLFLYYTSILQWNNK